MSELRQNALTGEWVIVAPRRADRPHPTEPLRGVRPDAKREPGCPFCPGNETETPPEILRYPEESEQAWRVRVFPNRYPALAADAGHDDESGTVEPLMPRRPGLGRHEVVVETPIHDARIEQLADDELLEVFQAYRARLAEAAADPRIRHAVLFRNYGPGAGASLDHPHAQLVGLPFVPGRVRRAAARSAEHERAHGSSLLLDLVEAETRAGSRVLETTDRLAVFLPYAGANAFEIWIAPRGVTPRFERLGDDGLDELARTLRSVLGRLRTALNDPDYNLILQSPPFEDNGHPAFPWYIQITPRFASIAGLEIGLGIRINPSAPEEAAEELRAHAG